MAQKRLMQVCSLSKLWLLKFAKQKNMKCYPRNKGKILESHEGRIRVNQATENTVWCCGRRLGRHRRRGGRRRSAPRDWRRSYRAHASRRRRR